jgi:hypothetical protein
MSSNEIQLEFNLPVKFRICSRSKGAQKEVEWS